VGRKSGCNYLVRLTVRKTKLKVEVEKTKEKPSGKSARYLLSTLFVGDVLEGSGAVIETVVSDADEFLVELEETLLELKERIEKWKLEVKNADEKRTRKTC